MSLRVEKRNVGEFTQIFIDGILHLRVRTDYCHGLQAYKHGKRSTTYHIELTGPDGWRMELSYERMWLWRKILKLLEA